MEPSEDLSEAAWELVSMLDEVVRISIVKMQKDGLGGVDIAAAISTAAPWMMSKVADFLNRIIPSKPAEECLEEMIQSSREMLVSVQKDNKENTSGT